MTYNCYGKVLKCNSHEKRDLNQSYLLNSNVQDVRVTDNCYGKVIKRHDHDIIVL